LKQEDYRKLISGETAGLKSALSRFFLRAAARVFSTIIALRNLLYSKGWLKTHRVSAVVISIGNITAGGTGKTPLTIWVCNWLLKQNISCAILTRGYKTRQKSNFKTQNRIDEPAILAKSCPRAKIIVNPDRVAGATEAVNKFGAKVLIMDDGFQHRRLDRDLDIVVIDAMRPFGYGKMLPAGLLREPVEALKRVDAVVITRCDQLPEYKLGQLERRLQSVNPDMIVVRSIHASVCAKSMGNEEISIEQLKEKTIFAFCGIGNPDAFLGTIRKLGLNLVGSKIYDDHHYYTNNDIADIYGEAKRLDANLLLSTQKDWTKTALPASVIKDIPFAYLVIELRFVAEEDKLKGLLERSLAGKIL